jgi:hypothetical protein
MRKAKVTSYKENLGGTGTKIIPYGDNYPWDFTRAALFDASFIKLREISLTYDLPSTFTKRIGIQNAQIGVYSRNIIVWTAAKIGIDPEMAFQPQAGAQSRYAVQTRHRTLQRNALGDAGRFQA